MNLIELRSNGATNEYVRFCIKSNITGNALYHRNGGWLTNFISNKIKNFELGKAIAKAIRNSASDEAMELINESAIHISEAYRLFENAFDANVCWCDHCRKLVYDEDCSSVDGDGSYCQHCLDEHYYWSDREDRYVSDEYSDDYDDDSSDGAIGGYHSSKRRLNKIPSSFDSRKPAVYLGMELEIEIRDGDREERAEYLLDNLSLHKTSNEQKYLYALCENDGSLNHGFEMVTGWTGLDVHEKQLSFFKERFVGARSHDTKTCGLHVHISKADMSVLHGTKIIEFINDPANRLLIKAIARRDESRWCAFKDKKNNQEWKKFAVKHFKNNKEHQLSNLNQDRYEAVNFQNPATIEFRLFKGTLRFETIMACLQFAYATYFFCKKSSKAKLTTEQFLEYLCQAENLKDTKYLREYLDQKGIVRADGLTLGAFSLISPDSLKEVA